MQQDKNNQPDKGKATGKTAGNGNRPDPNTKPAAEQAAEDISQDADLAPDESGTADLDEGELARADNSND
jgi:hypothetical protein